MSEDKLLPLCSSDDDAEAFIGSADLTGYGLSAITPGRFEFSSNDARVNMRLSVDLLDAVKATAARKGMSFNDSFARSWSMRCTDNDADGLLQGARMENGDPFLRLKGIRQRMGLVPPPPR